MRIVRKPIDVIAIFKRKELPMPIRVRMEVDGQEVVVKVERIIKVEKVKSVGKGEIVYTCQSRIYNNVEKLYVLKYLIDDFQWVLYKL